MSKQIIGYVRVGTARQGKSGLRLEAQRASLVRFSEAEGFQIAAEFVEVETGKGSDALERRPSSPKRSPRPANGNAPLSSPSSIGCPAMFISSRA
jgi:hypothetical protein